MGTLNWCIIAEAGETQEWMFDEALCSPAGVSTAWLLLLLAARTLTRPAGQRGPRTPLPSGAKTKPAVYGVMKLRRLAAHSHKISVKIFEQNSRWHLFSVARRCDCKLWVKHNYFRTALDSWWCVIAGGWRHMHAALCTRPHPLLLCRAACLFLRVILRLWAGACAAE